VKNEVTVHFYFKLFNIIKEEHEVDFAELELLSLFGIVKRIRNFADVVNQEPLKYFTTEDIRIQDILIHELPYGKCQGFYGLKDKLIDVSGLVKRLAYTREFFMIVECAEPEISLQKVFKHGVIGKNVQYFRKNELTLFRFITHQYFLEKSQYISKISRNEKEIDKNVEILFQHLTSNIYRIPATETMSVGKRLEDYFSIREEPSLYLSHYMHPYKGKFHPKMVRALLNYVYPNDKGLVMDNFAGSGTLLVEATLMGLDSIGIEINPLSVLMSNVKCHSLNLEPEILKAAISEFLEKVKKVLITIESQTFGYSSPVQTEYDFASILRLKKNLPDKLVKLFKNHKTIDKILLTYEVVKTIKNRQIRDFLLLSLSGAISDLIRRRRSEFLEVLKDRLCNLYLRVYLFHKLNNVLKIELGQSETYVGDARNMKHTCKTFDGEKVQIIENYIDAIVTSPPYSTALDYIRNDFPQLVILNLVDSLERLEMEMIGNPNLKYYPKELLEEIKNGHKEYIRLPDLAKESISRLIQAGRIKEALRTYKFAKDMYLSIEEMHRVMKSESKCVVIIGNNHYKLNGGYEEIKNDEIIKQIAEEKGFKIDRVITRNLEKTMSGMIRYESIIILEKT
jgi:site-specific DNA-methyltransferase (cytosine-N4-specific)